MWLVSDTHTHTHTRCPFSHLILHIVLRMSPNSADVTSVCMYVCVRGCVCVCCSDPSQQVYIAPSPWWLTHMLDYPPSPAEQAAAQEPARRAHLPVAACAGALRSLQWVYGRVVNTASEVFLKRQREHQSGRDREAALLDLYDDLAFGWRSLQAALDQRARLEELRKGARAQFALVRHIEEEARHCHAEEAAEFLEVLMTTHQAAVGGANALAGAVAGATAVPAGSPSKESLAAREALTMSDHPRINMCEVRMEHCTVSAPPVAFMEPSTAYSASMHLNTSWVCCARVGNRVSSW